MTPRDHQRLSEVLAAVIEADPDQRADVLDQSCGADEALRANVESLLRHHDHPAPLLDDPSFWSDVAPGALDALRTQSGRHLDRSPARPRNVGRYRIIDVLGEGGMGIVYLAEQDKPRRTVALKVMRFGAASAETRRRFEFEQEALGRLQHPGIAQIFEAAIDDDGQPFFAMEYVAGSPLGEYARCHQLSVSQRLELVARICDAVHHAHQRGVIHRDLKPRNILVVDSPDVGQGDSNLSRPVGPGVSAGLNPQPKILDFGVARAIGADAQAATLHTDAARLVGTLPYMSPEQFSATSAAVDARTDVYALGVILYETLTGKLPHDFSNKTLYEAARVVHATEPTKPGIIDRKLRGDPETIVLKALERDVSRRYQSAAQLAEDIRRHLAGQPIIARQDSAVYVLRKHMHRHRWATAACLSFACLLVGFAGYAAWQAQAKIKLAADEREARKAAEDAQQRASVAREQEVQQRKAAEGQTARAQAVTEFLVNTLSLADPDISQDANITVNALLEESSSQIGHVFADQPEAEATVRTVMGRAYAAQGNLEAAEVHLRRALEIRRKVSRGDHRALYEVLWPFWRVLTDLDDLGGRGMREDALRTGRRLIAAAQPELATALDALTAQNRPPVNATKVDDAVDGVIRTAQESLAPDDPLWIILADQLLILGDNISVNAPPAGAKHLGLALEILRARLPETNTRVLRTLELLISNRLLAGEHVQAEQLIHQSLDALTKILPDDHWYTAVHRARLAECLIGQKRFAEAETLLQGSYGRIVAARGQSTTEAIRALQSFIALYERWDKPELAQSYRRPLASSLAGRVGGLAMQNLEVAIGPQHPELIAALHDVRNLAGRRRTDIAAAIDKAMALWSGTFERDDPMSAAIADAMEVWAIRHRRNGGDSAQTVGLLEELMRVDQAGGHRHPRKQANPIAQLALSALDADQHARAEALARQGIAMLESGPPEHYGYTGVFQGYLGQALMDQERYPEAEAALIKGFEELRDSVGISEINTGQVASRLAELYQRMGQPQRAEFFALLILDVTLDEAPDAVGLNRAAWRIVKFPGYSSASYAKAVAAVERADALSPNVGKYLNTLGVGLYRLNRFDEALAVLQRSNERSKGVEIPDHVFLAMTNWQLGRHDDARAALEQARQMLETAPVHADQHVRMYREAVDLIQR